ncbi:MAG: SulP family inorganic anion transporter [Rhizobiaceae bacterium]|nr:SulP family inorganic anion transporter [Rhizobiaceae bacterium]
MTATTLPAPPQPSFVELYTPKLVTVLREGYGLSELRRDAVSGLTVAIVALPLSMAIAIASGVSPDRGLYTAIVGGFLVSLLGGSRFQIGGPAGAFIVLVAATVQAHGVEGLMLATLLSGVMLAALGFLRLGSFVKFIPYPVTVGFTAGIAVIIFASQIGDLFGLVTDGRPPAELIPKLETLARAANTVTPAAVAIAALSIATILLLKRYRPGWPGLLIAVALGSVAAAAFGLPVATIGSTFGGIPRTLPAPALPDLSPDKVLAVLPSALSFTLLGAIESLLSAVVADGMSGRRHRSNCELVAQGAANFGAALFGGFCVTGTIARTATNVRSGAHGPVSGMLHALFLLVFMLVAAPLAAYVPLASLAGVLAVVSFNMVEWHALRALLRSSWGDAAVVVITFLLVVFRELTEGIVVGTALGALLFISRMSREATLEAQALGGPRDAADEPSHYDAALAADPHIVVYKLSGAFFFGSAATVGAALDRIADPRTAFVLDLSDVPLLDSTAANVVETSARKAKRKGVAFFVAGARPAVRRVLFAHGVRPPLVKYATSTQHARDRVERALKRGSAAQ